MDRRVLEAVAELTLREEWSPQARVAAAAARRSHRGYMGKAPRPHVGPDVGNALPEDHPERQKLRKTAKGMSDHALNFQLSVNPGNGNAWQQEIERELAIREVKRRKRVTEAFNAALHPRGAHGQWRTTLKQAAERYDRISRDLPHDRHAKMLARSIREASSLGSPDAAMNHLRRLRQGARNVLDHPGERVLSQAIRDIEKDLRGPDGKRLFARMV